jgi:hypothetical protein
MLLCLLTGHDAHAKFHEDRFRLSRNIKIITSTIWGASVLVLLMGEGDYLWWHDAHAKFHDDRFRHSKVIRRDTQTAR